MSLGFAIPGGIIVLARFDSMKDVGNDKEDREGM